MLSGCLQGKSSKAELLIILHSAVNSQLNNNLHERTYINTCKNNIQTNKLEDL
jgi:hypothetical protein